MGLAAGDGSFAGQPRTATLLPRPERRKWDGRPRLSAVGQAFLPAFPGRQLRWAAGTAASLGSRRLPYCRGRSGESGMGVLACPMFCQPVTAASLGSRGRLPYWPGRSGESGMGVLACLCLAAGTAASLGSRGRPLY